MRKFGLFLIDILILYASLYATLAIRYGRAIEGNIDAHILPFSILFAFWVVSFYIANLYEIGFTKNRFDFFRTLLYVITIDTAIAIAYFYLTPSVTIAPRRNLFIFILISTA